MKKLGIIFGLLGFACVTLWAQELPAEKEKTTFPLEWPESYKPPFTMPVTEEVARQKQEEKLEKEIAFERNRLERRVNACNYAIGNRGRYFGKCETITKKKFSLYNLLQEKLKVANADLETFNKEVEIRRHYRIPPAKNKTEVEKNFISCLDACHASKGFDISLQEDENPPSGGCSARVPLDQVYASLLECIYPRYAVSSDEIDHLSRPHVYLIKHKREAERENGE